MSPERRRKKMKEGTRVALNEMRLKNMPDFFQKRDLDWIVDPIFMQES